MYWSLPAREAIPGSIVLIEHPSPEFRGPENMGILLATAQIGSGRTAYMGFNSSWRWRRVGQNHDFFDKYWTQMVRFLTEGKLAGGQARARIMMDRDTYRVGDRIRVRVVISPEDARTMALERTLQATYSVTRRDGVQLPPIRIELVDEAESLERRQAIRDAEQPIVFEGALIAVEPGDYELSVPLPTTDRPITQTRTFQVEVPRLEFDEPTVDLVMWRDLAERTETGRALLPGEAINLIDHIDARTETTPSLRAPQRLAYSWFSMILLGTLLTLEWGLRKGFKLL